MNSENFKGFISRTYRDEKYTETNWIGCKTLSGSVVEVQFTPGLTGSYILVVECPNGEKISLWNLDAYMAVGGNYV